MRYGKGTIVTVVKGHSLHIKKGEFGKKKKPVMPWKQTTMFEEKQEFINEYLTGNYTVSELCRVFEISRPTGYRLIKKYNELGEKGLLNLSTAPKHHPNETATEIQTAILYFRNKHKNWGLEKFECS